MRVCVQDGTEERRKGEDAGGSAKARFSSKRSKLLLAKIIT